MDAKFCSGLFRIYGDDLMVFLPRSFNMVNYVNGFLKLNHSYIPEINHTQDILIFSLKCTIVFCLQMF